MVEERNRGDRGVGLVVGGAGGTVVGTILGMLLAGKPAEAAPPEAQWNYLIECQLAIIRLLENLITAVEGISIAPPSIEVTVKTPWEAKEPEVIFDRAITSAATVDADKMVNWTKGKRLIIKVESLLDQDCDIQVVGNITDNYFLATDINAAITCPAQGNTSIGLAWDDWHPYIGVRIITAIAPTSGILTVSAVIQE